MPGRTVTPEPGDIAAAMCEGDPMEERPSGMSMFDYNARPAMPQVILIGERASGVGYQIRDFLSRNRVPYEWVELDDERAPTLAGAAGTGWDRLPICVLP